MWNRHTDFQHLLYINLGSGGWQYNQHYLGNQLMLEFYINKQSTCSMPWSCVPN